MNNQQKVTNSKPLILIIHYFHEFVKLSLAWYRIELQHFFNFLFAQLDTRYLRHSDKILSIYKALPLLIVQLKQRFVGQLLVHLNLSHLKYFHEFLQRYLLLTFFNFIAYYLFIIVVSRIHYGRLEYFLLNEPAVVLV